MTDHQIKNIAFLESRNALIVLSQKCLYVVNTTSKDNAFLKIETTFENITSDCDIHDMLVQPLSKTFIKENYPETPVEEFPDECLIIFTLENGNILTALLRFDPPLNNNNIASTFTNATLLPQNLFIPKREKLQVPLRILAYSYDLTLDAIVHVDEKSKAVILTKPLQTIISTFN